VGRLGLSAPRRTVQTRHPNLRPCRILGEFFNWPLGAALRLPFEAHREVFMLLFALAAIMGGVSFVYVKKRRQRKAS
jgi:hypothetical protein